MMDRYRYAHGHVFPDTEGDMVMYEEAAVLIKGLRHGIEVCQQAIKDGLDRELALRLELAELRNAIEKGVEP